MQSQIEFLKQYANAKGYIVDEIITDIGSGLNYNRKKWNYMLQKIEEKRISKVIISHGVSRLIYNFYLEHNKKANEKWQN